MNKKFAFSLVAIFGLAPLISQPSRADESPYFQEELNVQRRIEIAQKALTYLVQSGALRVQEDGIFQADEDFMNSLRKNKMIEKISAKASVICNGAEKE